MDPVAELAQLALGLVAVAHGAHGVEDRSGALELLACLLAVAELRQGASGDDPGEAGFQGALGVFGDRRGGRRQLRRPARVSVVQRDVGGGAVGPGPRQGQSDRPGGLVGDGGGAPGAVAVGQREPDPGEVLEVVGAPGWGHERAGRARRLRAPERRGFDPGGR